MSSDEQWHITKSINLGHIVTTASLLVALLTFGLRLESAVATNADNISDNRANIMRVELEAQEQYQSIISKLDSMNMRLTENQIEIIEKLSEKADRE